MTRAKIIGFGWRIRVGVERAKLSLPWVDDGLVGNVETVIAQSREAALASEPAQ